MGRLRALRLTHEELAEAIHHAVHALPLTVGMRGVHELTWAQVCAHMPMDAERYRQAADAAFRGLGRKIPAERMAALKAARGKTPRRRPSARRRVTEGG